MKKRMILYFIGLIFVVAMLLGLKQIIGKSNIELSADSLKEMISTQTNSLMLNYDEFVKNTLKINLKDSKEIDVTLSKVGEENLYYMQIPVIANGFTYSDNSEGNSFFGVNQDGKVVTSAGGEKGDSHSYIFFGESFGYYAIPIYIVMPGNHQDERFSYEAKAKHNDKELAVWEDYAETPTYDKENKVTKWLVVFKLPLKDIPPENMKLSLTVSERKNH